MVTLDISSLLYNKYTTAERTKTIHRKQNATSREVQHSNIRFLTPPPLLFSMMISQICLSSYF